jgi:hypothetical protein
MSKSLEHSLLRTKKRKVYREQYGMTKPLPISLQKSRRKSFFDFANITISQNESHLLSYWRPANFKMIKL